MASPFVIFRKYQAVMLAVFGVIIIILFTIGDALQKSSRSEGDHKDPVVATWSGGKITRNELAIQRELRHFTAGFLMQVQRAGMDRGSRMNRSPLFTEQNLTSDGAVQTVLLAAKAQQLGLMITQEEIQQYLRDLGGQKVELSEMRDMIQGPPDGRVRRSVDSIINGPLREELLARRLLSFVSGGLSAMPPAEQFALFSKLKEQARVEVIDIKVDQFLGQVADPSDADLKAYFEQHKDELPSIETISSVQLNSPNPGFKLPRQIEIQYLKADWNDFVDRSRAAVTDEEIAKYYDEHKDQDKNLQQQDLPLLDLEPKKPKGDATPKKSPDDASKKSGDGKAGDASKKSDVPDKPDKADESGKSSVPKDKDEPKSDKKDTPAKDDGKSKDDKKPDTVEPKKESDAKVSPTPTPGLEVGQDAKGEAATQLVALQDKKEDPADKKAPDAAKDPKSSPSADAKAKDPAPAAEKSTPDKPAKDAPAPAKAGDSKSPPASPPKSLEKPKFKPLSEVKDYIQKKLAEEKAAQKLADDFKVLETRMSDYHDRKDEADHDSKVEQPAPVDFAELAKRYGLSVHKTGLMPLRDLSMDKGIGQSMTESRPLLAMMIEGTGQGSLYRPIQSWDSEGNWYISWKIEDKPEGVGDLAGDTRDAVIKQWKRGAGMEKVDSKARGLAVAEATALADRIRKGEKTAAVAKSLPEAAFVETNSFTWLTYGEAAAFMPPSGPPQLSTIEGIDQPGPAFMKTVFSTPAGGVAVALNHPQTHVYVIKVVKREPSVNMLMEDYLAHMSTQLMRIDIQYASLYEWQNVSRKLMDDLDRQYDLKWVDAEARKETH